MSKRILSLILAFALFLPMIPQISAAENLRPVVVSIKTWREDTVQAYSVGDDLYFSEDTFIEIAEYFEYYNDGETATFTRGCKVVEINLENATFKVYFDGNFPSSKPLELPLENIDGVWYFSASALLPWLNVTVSEKDGTLVVLPDEYSYWDIYGELDLNDYSVSYGDLIKQYAWNSKVVKAMQYFQDSAGQALQEKLGFEDEYGGSAEDYFDILECYLLDTAHTEYLADTVYESWNQFQDLIDFYDIELPAIFDVFDSVDEGILFAAHYYAFTSQHRDRMQTVTAILSNKLSGDYTDQLIDGALMAENSYTNWWQGILNTYVLNLDEALAGLLVDEIKDKLTNHPVSKAVMLALDITVEEIENLNRRIELMAPIYNLYCTGRELYETNYSQDISNLIELRCHAVLSLFAASENLRTLSAYSETKNMDDLARQYMRLAEECDDWMEMLNACALSQVNDSINYRNGTTWDSDKKRYSNDLRLMFRRLDLYEAPQKGLEVVEYGMFLAYTEDLPLVLADWELTNGGLRFCGAIEYCGEILPFKHYLFTDGLYSQFDTHLKSVPNLDSPNLTDHVISGDTVKLMDALDSYLTGRESYLCSFGHDFNSDGKTDKLYVIPEAMSLWLDVIDIAAIKKDFGEYVFTADRMDTLVLAETHKDGIHIRIMRLSPSSYYDLSPDGTLTTAGSTYRYQPDGTPFSEDTDYLLAYCLADYGTIYADFGDSSYTNPDIYGDGSNVWNCTCMLGEGLSLVFDFASDYEDPSAMPIYARIDDFMYWSGSTTGAALCPGLSMGMTYAEAAATIGLTPLEWAPEQTWSEPVYLSYGGDAGCALELYFIGSSEETAVLVSVNAIPIG